MALKEIREAAGLSRAQFADAAGISVRTLQDYEQGHKDIKAASVEKIYRMSQILGRSMEEIAGLKGDGGMVELYNIGGIEIAVVDSADEVKDLGKIDWKSVFLGQTICDEDGTIIGKVSDIGDGTVTVKGRSIDKPHRVAMVRAMDCIARHVNNESAMDGWLMCGVADGDITPDTKDEDLDYYVDSDRTFSELMGCFMRTMKRAEDGGLYCDGVGSK